MEVGQWRSQGVKHPEGEFPEGICQVMKDEISVDARRATSQRVG